MINIIEDFIPLSKEHRIGTKLKQGKPIEICIHSTGNANSTARNERNWLTNPSNTRSASWHICVDDKEAIMAIPLDEVAWHSGDTYGNYNSIGIEMCESGDREKVIKRTIELVIQLMKEFDIPIDKVKRHFDYSGKNCPWILNYNNWQGWKDFKTLLKKEFNNSNIVKDELGNAVSKIIKSGIALQYNSWKREDLMKLENVPALINKLGGIDKLAEDGIISDRTLWEERKYATKHVKALLIKYASKL